MSVKITDPHRASVIGDSAIASGSFELYVTETGRRYYAQTSPQANKSITDFQIGLDRNGLATVELWVDNPMALTIFFRTNNGAVESQGLLTENLDRLMPAAEGSAPTPAGDNGIGFFNYESTIPTSQVTSGTWSTLQNNALGAGTELRFAPSGVETMLDPSTGRIILTGLKQGDQVFIRHTISLTPMINMMGAIFRNLVGQEGSQVSLPFGAPYKFTSGAGTPSGLLAVESHFFVRDENSRLGGLLPQIKTDGDCDVDYKGAYISVMRHMM